MPGALDEIVTSTASTVRMKVAGDGPSPSSTTWPRLAAETGAPPHEVASRAEEAWRRATAAGVAQGP